MRNRSKGYSDGLCSTVRKGKDQAWGGRSGCRESKRGLCCGTATAGTRNDAGGSAGAGNSFRQGMSPFEESAGVPWWHRSSVPSAASAPADARKGREGGAMTLTSTAIRTMSAFHRMVSTIGISAKPVNVNFKFDIFIARYPFSVKELRSATFLHSGRRMSRCPGPLCSGSSPADPNPPPWCKRCYRCDTGLCRLS